MRRRRAGTMVAAKRASGVRPVSYTHLTLPTITLGQSFNIQTGGELPAEAVLMGLGSMTHSFDMNQRYVELEITQSIPILSQHILTIEAPADDRVAPPGQYMLFVLDDDRIPSEARIVKVE